MNASEIAMRCMVFFAVCTLGSLNTGTALLTASIPVYVPAPMLYECRIIKSSPESPNPDVTLWTSATVLFTTVGTFVRWIEKAYIITIMWVIINNANIGMVLLYPIDVLKYLNVSSSFKVHFDSVIPASLAGVFLHSTPFSSLYLNPPCPLQKLKCVQ